MITQNESLKFILKNLTGRAYTNHVLKRLDAHFNRSARRETDMEGDHPRPYGRTRRIRRTERVAHRGLHAVSGFARFR